MPRSARRGEESRRRSRCLFARMRAYGVACQCKPGIGGTSHKRSTAREAADETLTVHHGACAMLLSVNVMFKLLNHESLVANNAFHQISN